MKKKLILKSLLSASLISAAAISLAACSNNSSNPTNTVEPTESSATESSRPTETETVVEKEYTVNLITDEDLKTKSYTVTAGSVIKLPKLEKEGSTFLGWFTEDGDKVTSITGIFTDMDLYPQFESINKKVKLNIYGDTREVDGNLTIGEAYEYPVLFYVYTDSLYWYISSDTLVSDLDGLTLGYDYNFIYDEEELNDCVDYFIYSISKCYLAEGFGLNPIGDDVNNYYIYYDLVEDFLDNNYEFDNLFYFASQNFLYNLYNESNGNITFGQMGKEYRKFLLELAKKNKDLFDDYLTETIGDDESISAIINERIAEIANNLPITIKSETVLTDKAIEYLYSKFAFDEDDSIVDKYIKGIGFESASNIYDENLTLNDEAKAELLRIVNNYSSFKMTINNYDSSIVINEFAYNYIMSNYDVDFTSIGSTYKTFFKLAYKMSAITVFYDKLSSYSSIYKIDSFKGDIDGSLEVFSVLDDYIDNNYDFYQMTKLYEFAANAFVSINEMVSPGGKPYDCDSNMVSYLEDLGLLPLDYAKSIVKYALAYYYNPNYSHFNESSAKSYLNNRTSSYESLISSYSEKNSNAIALKYAGEFKLVNDKKATMVNSLYTYDEELNYYVIFSLSNDVYKYTSYSTILPNTYNSVKVDLKTKTITVDKFCANEVLAGVYTITLTKDEYNKLVSTYSLMRLRNVVYEYNGRYELFMGTVTQNKEGEEITSYTITYKNSPMPSYVMDGYKSDIDISLKITLDLDKKEVKGFTPVNNKVYTKYTYKSDFVDYKLKSSPNLCIMVDTKDGYDIYKFRIAAATTISYYMHIEDGSYLYYYFLGENSLFGKIDENNNITIDLDSTLEDDMLEVVEKYKETVFTMASPDTTLSYYVKDKDYYYVFTLYEMKDVNTYKLSGISSACYGRLVDVDFEKKTMTNIEFYNELYRKYDVELTGDSTSDTIVVKATEAKLPHYFVYQNDNGVYKLVDTLTKVEAHTYMDVVTVDLAKKTFKVVSKADKSEILDEYKDVLFTPDESMTDSCKKIMVNYYCEYGSIYLILEKTEKGYVVIDCSKQYNSNYCSCKKNGTKVISESHGKDYYNNIKDDIYKKTFKTYETASVVYVYTNVDYAKYSLDLGEYKFVEYVSELPKGAFVCLIDEDILRITNPTSDYIESRFSSKKFTYSSTYLDTLKDKTDYVCYSYNGYYIFLKYDTDSWVFDYVVEASKVDTTKIYKLYYNESKDTIEEEIM